MAVQYKDYYQTLGVPKTASKDDIRTAFRKLARVHHPDVAKDKKTAESKFKEINEAYEVLGDPEKRQKYDTLGADWERAGSAQTPPGWSGSGRRAPAGGASFGGTGFSDFFEQFFSGQGRRQGSNPFAGFGGAGEGELRGEDVEADLLVSLEEAYHGAKKKISFRRAGSSKVEAYEVAIPKGVRPGQRIRLAGQGSAGTGGHPAGDLYLRVRLERHPDYQVEGADIVCDLDLPAWQAVLGAEVQVPTPEGSMRLKIAPGSQAGRKYRVKGRGLPTAAGGRGDFYVKLNITVPTTLTDAERALWEQLATHWK